MPDETRFYGRGQPPDAGGAALGLAPTAAVIPTARALDATVAASPVRFSQPVAVELPAGTTVGEYIVQRKLGEGGMGTVYAGEQPTIGKLVAIKVLAPHCANDPELLRRFVEEARAANRIRHPNIIDIFSFGQLPDLRLYFVMELLDGESLAEAIDKGTLRPNELRRLLCQICGALEASHQVGIVHRDLKPENIWIARPQHGESYVKLLDFGIAKLLDPTRTNLTQTGAVMGTPLFMAPEQCMGREIDARTDIYALGVILYLIFAGQFPFQGTVITELVFRHVTEEPAPPSRHRAVPPDLERIILECLAKDPAARPQTAKALGDRLAAVLDAWPGINAGPATGISAPLASTVPPAVVVPATKPILGRAAGHVTLVRRPAFLVAVSLLVAALISSISLLQRTQGNNPVVPQPVLRSPPVAAENPAPRSRLTLTIQNGPNDRVLLDGTEIARDQAKVEVLEIAPGISHKLAVEAPGRRTFVKDFVVAPGASIDMAIALEHEEHQAVTMPGSGKTRLPGAVRTGKRSPTSAADGTSEPRPAPIVAEPAEPKPAHKSVPDDSRAPRPSRAQERGLLDVNPLRR